MFLLLLFPFLYAPSGTQQISKSLEASWQMTSEYSLVHGLRHGREIIYNYGPLGFLGSRGGLGGLGLSRKFFAFFWAMIVCLSLFQLFRGFLLLPAGLWVLHNGNAGFQANLEIQILLVVAMLGRAVSLDSERRWLSEVCLALVLAVAVFIKSSVLFLAALIFVLVPCCRYLERRHERIWRFSGFLILSFVFVWFLCGQQLEDLGPWLLGNFFFSRGYAAAMGGSPHPAEGPVFFALAFFLFVWGFRLRACRETPGKLFYLVLLGAMAWLEWKHGVIQSSWHLKFPLAAFPLLYLLLFAHPFPKPNGTMLILFVACGLGLTISCLKGESLLGRSWMRLLKVKSIRQDFSRTVANSKTFSGSRVSEIPRAWFLPLTAERVSAKSVDLINNDQSLVMVSQMNFHPRPVYQSFSAFNPMLEQMNRNAYLGPTRPDFLLINHLSWGGRLPAGNDALLLPVIFHNYTPDFAEKACLVLKAASAVPAQPKLQELMVRKAAFGELVSLKEWNGEPLWIEIHLKRTPAGLFKMLFYRAALPELQIKQTKSSFISYPFIPAVAAGGFLINPFLEDLEDILSLGDSPFEKTVEGFVLKQNAQGVQEYQSEYFIRLYRMPDLVNPGWKKGLDTASEAVAKGLLSGGLESYAGIQPLRLFWTGKQFSLIVRPPSEIRVDIPPEARRVRGGYQMPKRAYTLGGRTDGMRFMIKAEGEGGQIRELMDAVLSPYSKAGDRNFHDYKLALLPGDRKLILQTDPGKARDNSDDLGVWTRVDFDREQKPV